MIKKIFALMVLSLCAVGAHADNGNYTKGFSTWTVGGVTCLETATDITATITGFDIGAYRLTNVATSAAVYVSPDISMSNDTTVATAGEKIAAGSKETWAVGKNPDLANVKVKMYCRAASGAGSVRLIRSAFGYK